MSLNRLSHFWGQVQSAFANSQVTMQFLGHGDTNKNPVYPWYVQVNGVPTTLICDTTKKTIEIYRDSQLYELPEDLRTRLRTAIVSKCHARKKSGPERV